MRRQQCRPLSPSSKGAKLDRHRGDCCSWWGSDLPSCQPLTAAAPSRSLPASIHPVSVSRVGARTSIVVEGDGLNSVAFDHDAPSGRRSSRSPTLTSITLAASILNTWFF